MSMHEGQRSTEALHTHVRVYVRATRAFVHSSHSPGSVPHLRCVVDAHCIWRPKHTCKKTMYRMWDGHLSTGNC